MCRWFAYVSDTEPCILEDVLITPQHSLSKQVNEHYFPGLLSHEPGSTTTQAEINLRNSLYNMDGMGLAWYTNARQAFDECKGIRPAMYKTISTPLNDFNFRSLAGNTSTKACFAHIRATSGSPVTPVNNHPFIFGRHCFMHNGTVENFTQIRRELCTFIEADAFANIKGSTDSEHLAALYMTFLAEGKGKDAWEVQYSLAKMKHALQKTVLVVLALQQKQFGPAVAEKELAERAAALNLAASAGQGQEKNGFTPGGGAYAYGTGTGGVPINGHNGHNGPVGGSQGFIPGPGPIPLPLPLPVPLPGIKANSLNLATTDGCKLVACRFRNHKSEQPPSLYYSTTAGITLNRKYPDHPDGPDHVNNCAHCRAEDHGPHVIVASEPSTYRRQDWTLVPKNNILTADRDGVVVVEKMRGAEEWDGKGSDE